MVKAFSQSWALFLGMFLLMIGVGIQGTLLGIRGDIEGFSTFELSLVMSAYFAGFLGGSKLAPNMIRSVGHVRVFAALASFISAVLILYPVLTDPIAWIIMRVIVGFCISAVYVTAESWLNAGTTNETRGQSLSIYLIVQMGGVSAAQLLPFFGDAAGFLLFVIPSVLVSISFAPILLSATPTPPFETTKPMPIRTLFSISPLGCVGIFLMGGVFSAIFGMASVYGTQAELTVQQIAIFIAAIYVGGMVCQFPIGWLSDRMDRRLLILLVAAAGAVGAFLSLFGGGFAVILVSAVLIGGAANPLYGLLVAHTNDFLDTDDMASAAGQLVFLNGISAIIGPILTGLALNGLGPAGFFVFIAGIFATLTAYAIYRTTQRPAPAVEDTGDFTPVLPTASQVTIEAAQEVYADDYGTMPTDDDGEEHGEEEEAAL